MGGSVWAATLSYSCCERPALLNDPESPGNKSYSNPERRFWEFRERSSKVAPKVGFLFDVTQETYSRVIVELLSRIPQNLLSVLLVSESAGKGVVLITIPFKIITRMKLLFSNYLGDCSYSFQGSFETIRITVTVSWFSLQNAVTGNNSPEGFSRISSNYSYMI